MKSFRRGVLAFLLIVFFPLIKAQDLIINEIMQSNIDCITDDIREFPDSWVELYNPTDQKIYLEGYKLGDKKKPEKAYSLPGQYAIWPHSYFIIYCDKEGFNRHSTFRLESTGKGSLYLFHNDELIDKVEDYPAMPVANVSYGREEDGSDIWGYQLTPTPEAPNSGGFAQFILGSPVFSVPGRIGMEPVSLELRLPDNVPDGTLIRYTADGSEPTENSTIYTEPIEISDNCVIRAKLFHEHSISARSTTHSYIFHPQNMTLPIVSIVTDEDYFYSDQLGIFSEVISRGEQPNFMYDWRRPVNFELFETENREAVLNQICETRLKGNATRTYLIKSMVFYANKRFGTKRFDYEFFPDQKPGLTDFKSIEARNGGNDCYRTYMRDAVVQRMMGENTDIDWQAWRPAVFYINGRYYGILNIRERSNEDNIYSNHNGLEDIDLIENWQYLQEGDSISFNSFKEFYSQEGHTFQEYEERMDVDEFVNYFIANMFYANYDFPGNNCMMWRPSDKEGRWRWIMKDMDDALGMFALPYDFDYLDWLYNPDRYPELNWACYPEVTLLFRRLLELPEFQEKFVNTFAVYLGDFMTGKATVAKLKGMGEVIRNEWPQHYEINNPHWNTYEYFQNEIIDFILPRYEFMYDYLADQFGWGAPIAVEIQRDDTLIDNISFQNIRLVTGGFSGKYFKDGNMQISGIPVSSDFKGWMVETAHEDGSVTSEFMETPAITLSVPLSAVSINIYPSSGDTIRIDGMYEF